MIKIWSNTRLLWGLLILVGGLFLFNMFRHLSYPLLWNDEAETVMHGKRVLEYGYPKVFDGKNYVYPIYLPNQQGLAIDSTTNAYLGNAWAMFYWASIGVGLAEQTDDLYTKTLLLRLPFAIIGILGIFLLAWTMLPFFNTVTGRLRFMVLFMTMVLISVPLFLHLREVRYYSLVIFFGALILVVYTRYRFFKRMKDWQYALLLTLLLWLMFHVFNPVSFILMAAIGVFEGLTFINRLVLSAKTNMSPKGVMVRKFVVSVLPLVLAFGLTIPLLIWFKSFAVSEATFELYEREIDNFRKVYYWDHLQTLIVFFFKNDFGWIVLALKIMLGIVVYRQWKQGQLSGHPLRLSVFLSILLVVYSLIICTVPHYLYTRYFIWLLPLTYAMIAIDSYLLWQGIPRIFPEKARLYRRVMAGGLLLIFIASCLPKLPHFQGRLQEIATPFKGPLDELIPFIRENFDRPEDLVIATNYEECAYMYYLESKVTLGFILINVKEDLTIQPDIMVYRKGWDHPPKPFRDFLQKARYTRVSFPVKDYRFNNIPEINFVTPHLYRTVFTDDEQFKVDILLKVPPYQPE